MYKESMNSEFETVRKEYLKSMKKNMKKRLGKTGAELFCDLSKVLEPITVNEVTMKETCEAV